MQYIVCQIGGRQYLAGPGQIIEVDKLSVSGKKLVVDKVMLSVDGGKSEIGRPYLPGSVEFGILGNVKKAKIRVATYKAKANYRRVIGSRREVTRLKLLPGTAVKSKD